MKKRLMVFILALVIAFTNSGTIESMILQAYAEEIKEESAICVRAVSEAKAGEQVTIEVVANKDMYWNAFKLCLYLNSQKINTEKEAIQAIPENYIKILMELAVDKKN